MGGSDMTGNKQNKPNLDRRRFVLGTGAGALAVGGSGLTKLAGLEIEREEVTFPQWNWRTAKTRSVLARLIGASCFAVYRR